MRREEVYPALEAAIGAASSDDFRVLHFSVQGDHVHLIVEAGSGRDLCAGARGLSIRLARAINRRLRRSGPVWADRYHTRALETPLEVRNGIVHVLMNVKKHHPGEHPRVDPCSSAPWFDGFRDARPAATARAAPVRAPRTWLAIKGWRRHGLISINETPSSPRCFRRP